MALCLGNTTTPLTAAALTDRLAVGSLWVWVVEPPAALAPYLRPGDGLEVTSAHRDSPVVIVARDGLAVPALATTTPLGGVARLWRSHQTVALDRLPWRALIGRPVAWDAALATHRLLGRLDDLRVQLAPPPALDAREALEARIYSSPAVLESYTETAATGLDAAEEALLRSHLHAGDRLLDVGCGAGREAFGFAARGLTVTGVDVCAAAVRQAQALAARLGPGAPTFAHGALSRLDGAPGSYDAVYVSSCVYQTVSGRAQRVALLRRLGELVGPGGVVVFAAHVAVRYSRLGRLLLDGPRHLGERLGLAARLGEPGDRWVREWGPEEPGLRGYRHRFYAESAVQAEVQAAGLIWVERHAGLVVARMPGARGSRGVA